ncbi:MAG: hypothetical protein NTY68_02260 [Candidatus Micrarchaeota archaeon]|nr:hypothetical protein [Candidatus Micrarchaeota archaeon]
MADGTVAVKEDQVAIPRNTRRDIIKSTDRLVAQSMKESVDKMRYDILDSCSTVSAMMTTPAVEVKLHRSWPVITVGRLPGIVKEFENGAFKDFEKAYGDYERAFSLAKEYPTKKTSEKYYNALNNLIDKFEPVINDYADKKSELWLGWPNTFLNSVDYAGTALIPFTFTESKLISKAFTKAAKAVTERFANKMIAKPLAQELIKKEIKNTVNIAFNSLFAVSIASEIGIGMTNDMLAKPLAAKRAIDMSSFASMVLKPENKDTKNMLFKSMEDLGMFSSESPISAFEDDMKKIANPPPDITRYMESIGMQIAILAVVNKKPIFKGIRKLLSKSGAMTPETVAKIRLYGI